MEKNEELSIDDYKDVFLKSMSIVRSRETMKRNTRSNKKNQNLRNR